MSAKHTPGPWVVTKGDHGDAWGGYWQIDGEHDAVACNQFCYAPREQSAANARLIAAAPELLEALQAVLTPTGWANLECGPNSTHSRALAAVAKATGDA